MPFCLRAASCASAFCFAFGAIWRRWRSIVRVQFASASDLRAKLAARSATKARSKRRSMLLGTATDLAKLVCLLLLATSHDETALKWRLLRALHLQTLPRLV